MKKEKKPLHFTDPAECADYVVQKVGKKIVMGMQLGLGKPNNFINALYEKAKNDPSIELKIITALSLETPVWASDLERRMLEPLVKRVWGGYVNLKYVADVRQKKLPPNVTVSEFFYKAGAFLNNNHMQQNYISTNYSHAARDVNNNGMNVGGALLSKKKIGGQLKYSVSCNADTALDAFRIMSEREEQGEAICRVGEINNNLPFMYGDAVVDPCEFDVILENPQTTFTLFGAPKESVTDKDYMIGVNASSLIKDGGTLQIGIGSLGDAIAYGLILRHQQNDVYQTLLDRTGLSYNFGDIVRAVGGLGPFDKGLYGSTEMFVDTFLDLYQAGIMKRRCYDNEHIQRLVNDGKLTERIPRDAINLLLEEKAIEKQLTLENFEFLTHFGILKEGLAYTEEAIIADGQKVSTDLSVQSNIDKLTDACLGTTLKYGYWIHAGFFLGPTRFYDTLNAMSEEERMLINMTSVLNVNQLYANNPYSSEELKILQRKDGRFINAGLMVTLGGAIVSDGLANGKVVSGVGGQFNFICMAHELPNARGGIMIRSTRQKGSDVQSNIVYNYGHTTVPRHLRDIVITEYGIADLRSQSDKNIIKRLLNIADSRFQESLLQKAKETGKVESDYEIPLAFRNNYPEKISSTLKLFKDKGYFPVFPFGTAFTKEEIALGKSLREFKEKASKKKFKIMSGLLGQSLSSIPENAKPYLKRMQLEKPENMQEKMMQKIVIYALKAAGQI